MSGIQVIDIDSVAPHPDNPRRGNVAAIKKSLVRFGQVTPIVVQASTKFVVKGNHTLQAAKQLGWSQIQAIVMDLSDQTAREYLIVDNRTSDVAKYDENALLRVLAEASDLEGLGFTQADLAGIEEQAMHPDDAPIEGPTVEHTLQMAPHESERFQEGIEALQVKYGTRSLADTIQRAVDEARLAASSEAELGAPLQAKIEAEEAEDEQEALQDWWDWHEAWRGLPEYHNENKKQWKTLFVHFANREDLQSFSELVGQQLTDKTRFIWWPEAEIVEVMGKMRYVEAVQA